MPLLTYFSDGLECLPATARVEEVQQLACPSCLRLSSVSTVVHSSEHVEPPPPPPLASKPVSALAPSATSALDPSVELAPTVAAEGKHERSSSDRSAAARGSTGEGDATLRSSWKE